MDIKDLSENVELSDYILKMLNYLEAAYQCKLGMKSYGILTITLTTSIEITHMIPPFGVDVLVTSYAPCAQFS